MAKLKQKTHSGSKKRFKITGSKKIRRRAAYGSHLLGKKDKERKRKYKKDLEVSKGDEKNIKKMLGI